MSHSAETFYRHSWMSDDQWACACLVADAMGGFHQLTGQFKSCGHGVEILVPTHRMATYDSNGLTTLVLLAHERAIRVDLHACSPQRIRLQLHRRARQPSRSFAHHPSIEEAVRRHRSIWGEPNDARQAEVAHG